MSIYILIGIALMLKYELFNRYVLCAITIVINKQWNSEIIDLIFENAILILFVLYFLDVLWYNNYDHIVVQRTN